MDLVSPTSVLWRSFGSGLKAATCWLVQTARVWKPRAAFPSVATEFPEDLVFWAQNVRLTNEFVEAGQVLLKRRAAFQRVLTAALASMLNVLGWGRKGAHEWKWKGLFFLPIFYLKEDSGIFISSAIALAFCLF